MLRAFSLIKTSEAEKFMILILRPNVVASEIISFHLVTAKAHKKTTNRILVT